MRISENFHRISGNFDIHYVVFNSISIFKTYVMQLTVANIATNILQFVALDKFLQ